MTEKAKAWLNMLNDPSVFNENSLYVLASIYDIGGAATCSELNEKYGKTPGFFNMQSSIFSKNVIDTAHIDNMSIDKNGVKERWCIPYVGKKADKDQKGVWVWKLRPELYDALTEFEIWKRVVLHRIGKFYSWEIVDETTAIKTCDKSFYEFSSSGVPQEICWFFGFENAQPGDSRDIIFTFNGKDYNARVRNDTTDRFRTTINWVSDLKEELNILKTDDMSVVFKKVSDNKYDLRIKGGDALMTTKQILDDIKKYIAAKGFTYDGSLVENFYLSLKSKPFVILAGTSGTGKTRLAKLFAEAVGAEFKLVPVRPDWSDSSDLFGHTDLSGNFVKGPVIEFISKAIADPAKPYFLCLDEMNLARVEYYFSDFLSIIETREREDGRVVTGNIEICNKAKEIYGSLYIPDNLYVIGTVNMDETTFPFSKKVLDRANTIEFSYVDLTPKFNEYYDDASPIELQNSFIKTDYIKLSECGEYADYIGIICSELESINKILSKADAHIGYRVRDEICFYMINNKKSELLGDNDAMDNQIMQKILPRIQGSSSAVKNMLCELFKICAGDFEGYQTETNVAGNMMKAAGKDSCKYKNSALKIAGMVRRFEEDGFTSYWI